MMEVAFPMDIGTAFTVQPQSFGENITQENCQNSDLTLIDQNAVNYFKFLIRKYKKQMGDIENTKVCSGGLQNYLITHKEQKDMPVGQEQSKFENLPVSTVISYCLVTFF